MSENLEDFLQPGKTAFGGDIIYNWRHEVLHEHTEWVEDFDQSIADIAQQMVGIMERARGVGLAANQIGLHQRMFVARSEQGGHIVCINPEIHEQTGGRLKLVEGCLSAPGHSFRVPRFREITASWQDLSGEEKFGKMTGFEAQVFQHETDHLGGIMLYDRLSVTDRKRAIRLMGKEK